MLVSVCGDVYRISAPNMIRYCRAWIAGEDRLKPLDLTDFGAKLLGYAKPVILDWEEEDYQSFLDDLLDSRRKTKKP